ncbi:hypothetical protein NL676_016145 [Syzygium grande]|nr:hypothetical protein NL676_016145 [Syzygium grande]
MFTLGRLAALWPPPAARWKSSASIDLPHLESPPPTGIRGKRGSHRSSPAAQRRPAAHLAALVDHLALTVSLSPTLPALALAQPPLFWPSVTMSHLGAARNRPACPGSAAVDSHRVSTLIWRAIPTEVEYEIVEEEEEHEELGGLAFEPR